MKNKVITILFCMLLISFSILNIIIKDKNISTNERRYLEKIPTINKKNIMDRTYMEKLEKYTLDQFILRDQFRSLKAKINYNLFFKLDNNGIYLKGNYIFKTEYPTNINSINNFTQKINNIIKKLNKDNKIYYSIIPDKNYYVDDKLFLNIDYNFLYKKVKSDLNINYIELRDLLDLNDYYETDTHWKQENILDVAKRLASEMYVTLRNKSFNKVINNNFYGVYYGQSALNRETENITYLTNDIIETAVVKYYENKNVNSVYISDKLESFDKYEVFLDGASSFIEITNPKSENQKELVIFRDSFASSITPLLISAYSKITLIDTRYISSNVFFDLIEFNNQDVLFLYSTLIVNNSSTLKN